MNVWNILEQQRDIKTCFLDTFSCEMLQKKCDFLLITLSTYFVPKKVEIKKHTNSRTSLIYYDNKEIPVLTRTYRSTEQSLRSFVCV